MKQILFLFITLVLFSSLSCESDPTTTIIEGHVLQKESLAPIANAKMLIYQNYSKGLFEGIVEFQIDTIVTDAKGHFRWETDIDPYNKTYNSVGSFFIKEVEAPDHFGIYNNGAVSHRVNHLEHHKTEIIMTPHAYLTVHVTNEAIPETNYCRLFIKNESVTEDLFGNDMRLDLVVRGNTELTMFFATDPDLENILRDTFYMNAFESKTLNFIY